jgi:hypothetical protein
MCTGSAVLWDHLGRAALTKAASQWAPQSLALCINAFASKLCTISSSTTLSPSDYVDLARERRGGGGKAGGEEGGGGSKGERRGGGHALAEVMGEAILLLGDEVTSLPIHMWKAQEVSMVLNGFARSNLFFQKKKSAP